MRPILIQLDQATFDEVARIAGAQKRSKSDFVRQAIRRAIRDAEYAAMRRAYERRPDTEAEMDNWAEPEEYRP